MKHGTKIEWTHFPGYKGETWNPVVGCSHISPGCDNCYAEKWAARLASMGLPQYQEVSVYDGKGYLGKWNGKIACMNNIESVLEKPSHWRKPRSIFVCSMGDLFHEKIPDRIIMDVFDAMHPDILSPSQHIFLILTKRAERMYDFFQKHTSKGTEPWNNVWLGVTVEHADYHNRIDILRQISAAHKFVSFEPLLSDIPDVDLIGIDWVICGGESGPGARPMHPDWARSLRDQCQAAGTPFFFKQWGNWFPVDHIPAMMKGAFCGRSGHFFGDGTSMVKMQKASFRRLDGREWNEFPEVNHES